MSNITKTISLYQTMELSSYEKKIVQQLADGKTTAEISLDYGYHYSKVSNLLKEIRKRYGYKTVTQLVAEAIRQKIIE